MSRADDISQQYEILAAHRSTLAIYLKQQALQGEAFVTPGVVNGIREARNAIRSIKTVLRDWGERVEDLPDDAEKVVVAVELASCGLRALIDLIQRPEVNNIVIGYSEKFQIICGQIDLLNTYKRLHDLFQQLEDCYSLLDNDRKRLPNHQRAWIDLARSEPDIYGKLGMLLQVALGAPPTIAGSSWIKKLRLAQAELRAAIDDTNLQLLNHAAEAIFGALGTMPFQINSRLVAAAEHLPLDELTDGLEAIHSRIAPLQLEGAEIYQLVEFERGLSDLRRLQAHLRRLVIRHNVLQELANQLKRLELEIEDGIQPLHETWPDLKAQVEQVCDEPPAEWSTRLRATCADLEMSFTDQASARIQRLFWRFHSQVFQSFNQVDIDLLNLCGALRRVGESLALMLRMLYE